MLVQGGFKLRRRIAQSAALIAGVGIGIALPVATALEAGVALVLLGAILYGGRRLI